MRICLVSYEFVPWTGGGGAGAFYRDLAEALAALKHDVTVISGTPACHSEITESSLYRSVRIGPRNRGGSPFEFLVRAAAVFRAYRSEVSRGGPFDVVESPEIRGEGLIVNLIRRDEVTATRLLTPHFLVSRMNGLKTNPFLDSIERIGCMNSQTILTDCIPWGSSIASRWGIDTTRLRACQLGIDLARIDSVKFSDVLAGPHYVLYSGKLTEAKGPQIVAAAAEAVLRRCPEVRFVFVGKDIGFRGISMQQHILQKVPEQYRRNLVFLGERRSLEDLIGVYKGASICVKADVAGNTSMDLLGQMACAKPLVCTRTDGNQQIIESGVNGYLFDRAHPEGLASILVDLLLDGDLRRRIGDAARFTIEQSYTSRKCAERTVAIYEKSLSS